MEYSGNRSFWLKWIFQIRKAYKNTAKDHRERRNSRVVFQTGWHPDKRRVWRSYREGEKI